jgi:hypothetical protein
MLSFIKKHLCDEKQGVELRSCGAALYDEGKKFIKEFADEVGMSVKGWDDWYAIVPHGKEWTAEPGKDAINTGDTGRKYKSETVTQKAAGGIVKGSVKGTVKGSPLGIPGIAAGAAIGGAKCGTTGAVKGCLK